VRFSKYQALGNDYIVIDAADVAANLTPRRIRHICHRHFGVGSDGILLGSMVAGVGGYHLRIFNPDGSEAEKSGNGIRIFCKYLWEQGRVGSEPFVVLTKGGQARCRVRQGGKIVTVEMGKVSFDSRQIPVTGDDREVLNESIAVGGKRFRYCAATVGNPHCVMLGAEVSKEETCQYGPLIETDARFPHRTNVQFMETVDRGNVRIEIWERGAGYTLASGSSASAAAAVAFRLGLCDAGITVHMPGGRVGITVGEDYAITMTGPAARVFEGVLPDFAATVRTSERSCHDRL
jgi:diaminopimelate epimerase